MSPQEVSHIAFPKVSKWLGMSITAIAFVNRRSTRRLRITTGGGVDECEKVQENAESGRIRRGIGCAVIAHRMLIGCPVGTGAGTASFHPRGNAAVGPGPAASRRYGGADTHQSLTFDPAFR
jgi:hypothetical protein